MNSIKAHFDGIAVVLDEMPSQPLAVGQAVRVIVESLPTMKADAPDDLLVAATSSTDFWDNPVDDEVFG